MKIYNNESLMKLMPRYVKQNYVRKTFQKNEILISKNDNPQYVYFIEKGSFRVVNEFESGKIFEPVTLPKYDFIGAVEVLLDQKEIISTIVSNEESQVLMFPKHVFVRWINENHDFTKWILRSISGNFVKNMEESGEQIILNSRYQLVTHLLNNSVKEDSNYVLNESREKTSVRTGINIRTLYRHINELKDKDVIVTKGRKILHSTAKRNILEDIAKELRNK